MQVGNPIVQLHRLIPVVYAGCAGETIVARSPSWYLHIERSIRAMMREDERRVGKVIEVICWREALELVIPFPQILGTLRLGIRVVASSDVVRHKVYKHLETCLMRPPKERIKLFLPPHWILRQVWVNIVVVLHSIG